MSITNAQFFRMLAACTLAVPLTATVQPVHAQVLSCSASDEACIEREYVRACSYPSETKTACTAFLAEADTLDSPFATLMVAVGYSIIGDADNSDDEKQALREESFKRFQKIIERWPNSRSAATAYHVFSMYVETQEEQIELLRKAVVNAPTKHTILEAMASALIKRGEDADRLEAAELRRQIYTLAEPPHRWRAARAVVGLYESTLQSEQAALLRQEVRRESGLDRLEELLSGPLLAEGYAEFGMLLEMTCDRELLNFFGAEHCVRGVNAALAACRT